jgi:molybdate transport system substrate-binding protein
MHNDRRDWQMIDAGSGHVGRRVFTALAALAMVLGLGNAPVRAADQEVLVFAAASLKNALDEVGAAYGQATGTKVTTSYAASSALAKQIEQGAPAQMFISADLAWMDHLDTAGLIAKGTRRNLLGNNLVLVAGKDSPQADVAIGQGFDLASLLGDGRLAVGEVTAVPAGRYAKEALTHLGSWGAVESKLAQAENVRAALALVARGEAPLGIVYRTDAAADPTVRIVGTFPADSHQPIIYPAALTTDGANDASLAFLSYLSGPAAKAIFEKYGFTLIGPTAA